MIFIIAAVLAAVLLFSVGPICIGLAVEAIYKRLMRPPRPPRR